MSAAPARLVVVGATASGKTDLALRLAGELDQAEVLCVDSMTVYRGMNIGTAKATTAEQAAFVHHGIDLVDPDTDYSVAAFQRHANGVLASIDATSATAVLVGGTGLYVDSVVNGFTMPGRFPEARAEVDRQLIAEGIASLYARLVSLDPKAATKTQPNNDRRIVRALEVCLGSGRPFSSFGPGLQETRSTAAAFVMVAIAWPRAGLRQRIETRFARQLADGFLGEAEAIRSAFGNRLSRTARQALGYRELWSHLDGEASLDESIELAITRTRQFAVRQERWFKRDPRIRWLTPDEASTITAEELGLSSSAP